MVKTKPKQEIGFLYSTYASLLKLGNHYSFSTKLVTGWYRGVLPFGDDHVAAPDIATAQVPIEPANLLPAARFRRIIRPASGQCKETQAVTGMVAAVSRSPSHTMSKPNDGSIRLVAGLGVEGDAHQGLTVKHRSRVKKDPTVPNLRQVHLIHAELLDELRGRGFELVPGEMGENVTTRGVDLLDLPVETRLRLGPDAIIEVTGLRNPCHQLNGLRPGLMAATLDRDEHGNLVRKAGIMAVVVAGGDLRPGNSIAVELPPRPHRKLEAV